MQSSRRKGRVSYYIMGEERGGAGEEEMTEIQVVSGETTLIVHIETYQL